MDKQVDMQAFVGVDFDCEFFNSPDEEEIYLGQKLGGQVIISPLLKVGVYDDGMPNDYWYHYDAYGFRLWKEHCRPRLNKPQVVYEWAWVPDGLVWDVAVSQIGKYRPTILRMTSKEIRDWDYMSAPIVHIACIGAEPDYAEWANAHGVPVVEVSNG